MGSKEAKPGHTRPNETKRVKEEHCIPGYTLSGVYFIWGVLSPGAHCLSGHIASGVDCLWGMKSPGADCLRGRLSPGWIVSGACCLQGQIVSGVDCLGAHCIVSRAHCLRGGLSWGTLSRGTEENSWYKVGCQSTPGYKICEDRIIFLRFTKIYKRITFLDKCTTLFYLL